jgi:hypothetical protein
MNESVRVFISYSHRDKELIKLLVSYLEENCGITVIWDENLTAGAGFHEQIKDSIASAHIFMPLITKESSERGWVHQEIGYAMALNIPVLPVTAENLAPGAMLQLLQAVKIDENPDHFHLYFNKNIFESVLKQTSSTPVFLCARLPEERTKMIADYSNKISSIGKYGTVRQKGGLSSFHIPSDCILKSVWNERYFPEIKSQYHKRLQREERLALGKHAEKAGYKIIITPDYAIKDRDKRAAVIRLNTLIAFLQQPEMKSGIVVLQTAETQKQSLTMVGDWFMAESVSFREGDGFTNTFFTRDAAEISRRTEDFECELQDLLDQWGWSEENSREKALEELDKILKAIKP